MLATARDLGAALQRRRVELDLTQQQVCHRAGVARSWLSRLEAGKHPGAQVQKVLDVVAVLGMTLALVPAVSPPSEAESDPFGDLFGSQR